MPGIIGRNTLGADVIANFPNYPVCNVNPANLYTAVAGDVIDSFGFYGRDYYGTPGTVQVGAYSISGGVVGNLVGSAGVYVNNATPQWFYSASGLAIPLVVGTVYCCSMVATALNIARLFYIVVVSSRDNESPGTLLPASWTHANYTDGSFLAFANVIAGAAPSSPVGRPGIEFDPMNGMF